MIDSKEEFLERLRGYRVIFERLATKAENGADFNQAKECLTHAWKLTDHILTCQSLFSEAGGLVIEPVEDDKNEKLS